MAGGLLLLVPGLVIGRCPPNSQEFLKCKVVVPNILSYK